MTARRSAEMRGSPSLAAALVAVGTGLLAGHLASAESLAVAGFGKIDWSLPSSPPTRVVLLLRGDGTKAVGDLLATPSTLVVQLDAKALLRKAPLSGCAYPAGDLESLTELLEKRLAFPRYIAPVLAGTDIGAALAFATAAQAPVGTFPALLTVDFLPELPAVTAFCPGRGLHSTRAQGTTHLSPSDNFAPLWAAVTQAGSVPAETMKFLAAMPAGRVKPRPSVETTDFAGRLRDAWTGLEAELTQEATTQASEEAKEFGGLPVLALPAAGTPKGTLAIVVSGDGGWQGVDRKVMRELTVRGVAVAGLDSQRYFWNARSPHEVATDLVRIVRHYQSEWKCQRVVAVGYSAGADALAIVADELAGELGKSFRLLALMSPSRSTRLALFTDLERTPQAPERLVLPALRSAHSLPALCLYGESDRESPCAQLPPPALAIRLPGAHAFGGDAAGIAGRIVAAAQP